MQSSCRHLCLGTAGEAQLDPANQPSMDGSQQAGANVEPPTAGDGVAVGAIIGAVVGGVIFLVLVTLAGRWDVVRSTLTGWYLTSVLVPSCRTVLNGLCTRTTELRIKDNAVGRRSLPQQLR